MAKTNRQNKIALLFLVIFVMLMALNVGQKMGWLKLQSGGVLLVYALIFFLPTLIYAKRRRRKCKEMMRLHHFSLRDLPFVLLISIAICLICGILNVVGVMLVDSAVAEQPTAMYDFSAENPLVLWMSAVILPALTEELLIRGVALSEYEYFGSWRAVLVTSVVFALFHANPMHLISLLVAGICYAILTLLFNSVYPALIAHMLNNTLAVMIAYNPDYFTYIFSDPLFVIIAVIVFFLLMIITLKLLEGVVSRRGKRGKLRYKRSHTGTTPWRSIWLWLFAAGCIAKMVWTYFL